MLEEFFYRGVLQAKLERGMGQMAAIVWGGVLFGFKHLALDITTLSETNGYLAVFLALMLQTLSGWLLGIVYMKTRSLWPGIVSHYLGNWLPSILMGIFG
jgi:membrane protease YdiL (CAAX protease family)